MSEFVIPSNVTLISQTKQLKAMHTFIRDKNSTREEFILYGDRIIRLLLEATLDLLPFEERTVTTPTMTEYQGLQFSGDLCGVSIVRAGESMETTLRAVVPAIKIGKILIQRDPNTHLPKHYYTKLPLDISKRFVLLLDPLLATAGSSIQAIYALIENGVKEENIFFVNIISCYEGLERITKEFPAIKIITSAIDPVMNENKYILPGCGDYGDRYFGTE